MQKEELFKKAQQDVQYALILGNSVINGLIKVGAEEIMELYYLLRRWQDKLGQNVPLGITQIIKHIEYVGDDATPILKEYYEERLKFEKRFESNPQPEPAETKPVQEEEQKPIMPYPFFIPINNGGIVS